MSSLISTLMPSINISAFFNINKKKICPWTMTDLPPVPKSSRKDRSRGSWCHQGNAPCMILDIDEQLKCQRLALCPQSINYVYPYLRITISTQGTRSFVITFDKSVLYYRQMCTLKHSSDIYSKILQSSANPIESFRWTLSLWL